MKNVKIRFHSIVYRSMKNIVSIWWLLTPSFERYWGGKITYIGLRGWNIEIDTRGINNISDFAREMTREKQ